MNHLSKCCKGQLTAHSSSEGTSYYECEECYKPCDITPEPKNELMWLANIAEQCGEGDPAKEELIMDMLKGVAECQRIIDWKEFREMLKEEGIIREDKIMKQKPSHGTCCTCGTCGFSHSDGDDCYCESNRWNEMIDSKLSSLKSGKKSYEKH